MQTAVSAMGCNAERMQGLDTSVSLFNSWTTGLHIELHVRACVRTQYVQIGWEDDGSCVVELIERPIGSIVLSGSCERIHLE
jgi:hypothetical protein